MLRQLRKLPWSECEPYILKCFMKVYKGKYGQIHLIASLAAGLSRYHDEFAVAIVDEVIFFYVIAFFICYCQTLRKICLICVLSCWRILI